MGHALCGRIRRTAPSRRSWLLRRVFRGALGLQLLGMEDAIASEATVGQCLGIVFERIGRRLGAAVRNLKSLIVLYQDEFNFRSVPLDRTGLNIPRNPQALGVGRVSHSPQFLDSDVIALALLDAGISEIPERQQDDYRGTAEFQVSAAFAGHERNYRLHELYSSARAWVKDRKDSGLQFPISFGFSEITDYDPRLA